MTDEPDRPTAVADAYADVMRGAETGEPRRRSPSSPADPSVASTSTGDREIKDDVLRMGSWSRTRSARRSTALVAHDADAALGGHRRRPPHQRGAARGLDA